MSRKVAALRAKEQYNVLAKKKIKLTVQEKYTHVHTRKKKKNEKEEKKKKREIRNGGDMRQRGL